MHMFFPLLSPEMRALYLQYGLQSPEVYISTYGEMLASWGKLMGEGMRSTEQLLLTCTIPYAPRVHRNVEFIFDGNVVTIIHAPRFAVAPLYPQRSAVIHKFRDPKKDILVV